MTTRPSLRAAAAVAALSLALVCGCSATTTASTGGQTVGTGTPPGTKAPGTTTTKVPTRNQWDKVVEGAPIAFAGSPKALEVADPAHPAPGGIYLWIDKSGWHARVIRNAGSAPVEITVEANEQKGSSVKVTKIINSTEPLPAEGTTVTIKLPAAAASSGFDMTTGLYTNKLSFTVKAGTTPVPAGQIFLGQTPTPATENPVRLTRSNAPH